jgi:hypothetical protein
MTGSPKGIGERNMVFRNLLAGLVVAIASFATLVPLRRSMNRNIRPSKGNGREGACRA